MLCNKVCTGLPEEVVAWIDWVVLDGTVDFQQRPLEVPFHRFADRVVLGFLSGLLKLLQQRLRWAVGRIQRSRLLEVRKSLSRLWRRRLKRQPTKPPRGEAGQIWVQFIGIHRISIHRCDSSTQRLSPQGRPPLQKSVISPGKALREVLTGPPRTHTSDQALNLQEKIQARAELIHQNNLEEGGFLGTAKSRWAGPARTFPKYS